MIQKMKAPSIAQFRTRATILKTKIAKKRDELRELISDLEAIRQDSDDVIISIDQALNALEDTGPHRGRVFHFLGRLGAA